MRITYRDKNNHDYWTKRWTDIESDKPMVNVDKYPLRYSEILIQEKNKLILEAGCGAGRILRYYHDNGYKIIGIDFVREAIDKLRKIDKSPMSSQRDLAYDLGFSLGKLNYCLKELKKKGLVKIKSFQNQKNKITHLRYLITPKGVSIRTKLTIDFMKRKIKGYDELSKELKQINGDKNVDDN